MRQTFLPKPRLVAAAIVIALFSASLSLAQTDSSSGADGARQAQIKVLKEKIDKLQSQVAKLESEPKQNAGSSGAAAAKGCCGGMGAPQKQSGAMAQAAGEPSLGAEPEHAMGGMGDMGGSPAASPGMEHGGGMMEGHMKGMEHMHGMMHSGEGVAKPAASPGAMPMEHKMGGMGDGGMEDGGMQGGASPQPEASPGAAMGGGMKDDM